MAIPLSLSIYDSQIKKIDCYCDGLVNSSVLRATGRRIVKYSVTFAKPSHALLSRFVGFK